MDADDSNRSLGDGFLETWRDVLGFDREGGPQSLSGLLKYRCLVLCGEPGIGKTTEVDRFRAAIETKANADGGGFYARSFRESLNPEHLVLAVKASPEWMDWEAGKELTILIDGVDEGLALASNLIVTLKAELRGKQLSRLQLILVCRDAEWPLIEGAQLLGLWPTEHTARFQLQRLRASDAEQGALVWGLNSQQAAAFMKEVGRKGLEPFAARPITLKILVQDFIASQELSDTRSEIYRRACLRLCREDPERSKLLQKVRNYKFTAAELLPVANRLAAWMLLCRFTAVSELFPENKSQQHLDIQDLVSISEKPIEREKIETVFGSALFTDAGQQARRFAHQSYMEFLAAEYLHSFPLNQILDLVTVHHAAARFVAPQLAELAAWLALRHDEFLDWCIENEPEILLRNDASSLIDMHRSKLVASLLHRFASGRAIDDWSLKRFYRSLDHPGLAAQLKPYLVDPTANIYVRRAAIHLADSGKALEVFDELFSIAKNETEDSHLREQAMNAVKGLVPDNRLVELVPFALKQAGEDRHDELRAAALEALVPRLWPVSRAIDAVVLPRNPNFFGAFDSICSSHLPNHIVPSDLPELFARLQTVGAPITIDENPLSKITKEGIRAAVSHLGDKKIGDSLLQFVLSKLRNNEAIYLLEDIEEANGDSQSERQRLAEFFVRAYETSPQEISSFLTRRHLILKAEDTPWLIRNLRGSIGPEKQLWAVLVGQIVWEIVGSSHRELLFEGCGEIPELAKQVGWPGVTDLNSEGVITFRRQFLERREREQRSKVVNPSATESFHRALADATADSRHWRKLAWELQRDQDRNMIVGASADPASKERWLLATLVEQGQIIQCAVEFLLNTPGPGNQIQSDSEYPPHEFWALWMAREHFATNGALREKVVNERFEILCSSPFNGSIAEQELTRIAVEIDPNRAGKYLQKRLEHTTRNASNVINVLRGYQLAWIADFTGIVTGFVQQTQLSGYEFRHVVEFLSHRDFQRTQAWLGERLKREDLADEGSVAAVALVLFANDFWKPITADILADEEFGRAVLQAVADIHECSSFKPLEKLSVSQLSDLFIVLEKHYPPVVPIRLIAEQKGARARVERFRNFIPQHLESVATVEACDELERLSQVVPHWKDTLTWRVCQARHAVLRSRWAGVPIEILRGIEECREARWVRNEDDLLLLTMDSLRRFQDELNRTEYPLVRSVWNEKEEMSPKHENALTEQIGRWLKNDLGRKNGVVIGCQVEPTIVHETDIELTASMVGAVPTGKRFVLTIEVKCSFNREVAKSLEAQLSAEYLKKLGRTHGVYVVGWFRAPGWKPERNPLCAKSYKDAETAVAQLLAEAIKNFPELRLDAICLNCEFPQAFRKSV